MTVAVDKRTGRVIGQLVTTWPTPVKERPTGGDRGPQAQVRLLTDTGYMTVLRASVRLEEV